MPLQSKTLDQNQEESKLRGNRDGKNGDSNNDIETELKKLKRNKKYEEFYEFQQVLGQGAFANVF